MDRITYHGTPYATIHGMTDPIYSDYPIRAIMNKLAEYEDAEEQGLLLRLPCKVGDTVWNIKTSCLADYCNHMRKCLGCDAREIYIVEAKFGLKDIESIGKTVFLTKEEAEQALQKGSEENG